MSISAYPLAWPPTFPRAKYRESGKFKTALPNAIKNVQASLRNFAGDSGKKLEQLVISSNVSLAADAPADPGVAVYFTWDGLQVCIPVDRYHSVASNLQAIHHIIEARRVELRHGSLMLVRATFQGFLALPAPASQRSWWQVLDVDPACTREQLDAAYRRLAGQHHPDKPGGSHEQMSALNAARDQAIKERFA